MNNNPEKIIKEMKRKQALKAFQELRYAEKYNEEILSKEKLSDLLKTPGGIIWYKCGKPYFSRVIQSINNVLDMVSEEVRARALEFKNFIESLDEKFQKGEVASREDIDKANEFLDYIISKFEKPQV